MFLGLVVTNIDFIRDYVVDNEGKYYLDKIMRKPQILFDFFPFSNAKK